MASGADSNRHNDPSSRDDSPRESAEGPPAMDDSSVEGVDLDVVFPDHSGLLPALDDVDGDEESLRLRDTVCAGPLEVNTTMEAPEHELKAGQTLANRYQIIGEIARGGMGVVLKVWDRKIKRHCAIKMLHKHHSDNAGLRRRFEREARLNGLMEHPGIVPMHEIYLDEPEPPFFSMRYMEGSTLFELLQARSSPEDGLSRSLQIFNRVCETIAYAHSRRVVHRDIKSQNILVGAYGVVKLMDWGLAKLLNGEEIPPADFELWDAAAPEPGNLGYAETHSDQPATQHGLVCGTLSYAPPEQARGDHAHVNERSDVFALGGVLCEILTGRPTYVAGSLSSLYKAALAGNVTNAVARLHESSAERALIDIAIRCLQPDPADRFSNADDVTQAVTDYLASDLRRVERDQVRFFDLSLDLFCIAGLNGYFRRVNVNFERVLGYSRDELLSRPFVEFVLPEDVEPTVRAVQQLQDGLPVVRFMNRYRHRDGHLVTLEWAARSVPEERVIYAVARERPSAQGTGWSLALPDSEQDGNCDAGDSPDG